MERPIWQPKYPRPLGGIERANSAIEKHCDRARDGEVDYDQKFESSFFEMRIYKKGTIHIWFRDESVRQAFNVRVAQLRKWIAPENG